MMATEHQKRLYDNAIAMDSAFSDALREHGIDRYETPEQDWPREVRAAYAHKRQADEAMHLDFAWHRARTRAEQDRAVRDYFRALDTIRMD